MANDNEDTTTEGVQTIEDEMAEFDSMSGTEVSFDDEQPEEGDGDVSEETETIKDGEEDNEETEEEIDSDEETEEVDEGAEEESGEDDEDAEELDDEDKTDEDEEPDDKDIIANLRLALSDKAETKVTKKTDDTEESSEEEESTNEAEVIADFEYATAENFDDIMRDPEAFNKALNAGIKIALEQANKVNQQNAVQALNLNLPAMVQSQMVQQQASNDAVEGFYKEHPLLNDFRNLVGNNINEVIASDATLPLTEVMKAATERTYKQLQLSADAVKESKITITTNRRKKPKNTGLRKKGRSSGNRGRNLGVNKSELQKEMDEIS